MLCGPHSRSREKKEGSKFGGGPEIADTVLMQLFQVWRLGVSPICTIFVVPRNES